MPPRSSRRGRAVVAAALFMAMLALGGWWAGRELVTEAPARPPSVSGARLFDQVTAMVAQRYVDSLGEQALYDKAVAGMLKELQDPYTAVLGEDRLRRLSEQMSGTYAGIGLQFDMRDGWPVVVEVIPGSPSERAGILAGDRIMRVGGESPERWTRDEVTRALRGPQGSTVKFTVERGGQPLPFALVRDKVHLTAIHRVALFPNGVGYVDVNVFSAQTASELSAAIDSVVRLGARALVLDLRGNPGGLLEQGVAVAELFLDEGETIVQLRGRPGAPPQQYTDSAPQRWPTMPLAVLVDRASASSSEIVAGALQDHDRALVVGVASYGKGSAQNVYPLANGGALRITVARWYTPLGRGIDRPPQTPAEDEAPTEEDVTGPDTIRPTFRTEAGRTVLGGGGITPDIVVGDTATPLAVQALARAMGRRLRDYRDALARQAQLARRSLRSPEDPVTPAMLDAVFADLTRRGVAPPRPVFDEAAPWISRSLGYEMIRVAYGADAEFQRRAKDDAMLGQALARLGTAKRPQDVFTPR